MNQILSVVKSKGFWITVLVAVPLGLFIFTGVNPLTAIRSRIRSVTGM